MLLARKAWARARRDLGGRPVEELGARRRPKGIMEQAAMKSASWSSRGADFELEAGEKFGLEEMTELQEAR